MIIYSSNNAFISHELSILFFPLTDGISFSIHNIPDLSDGKAFPLGITETFC